MSFEESTRGKKAKSIPLYIAINEYFKRMEDELNMKPGDKIEVITDDGEYNDGWYYGRNLRTKEEGLYPAVFTKKIASDQPEELRKMRSQEGGKSGVNYGTLNELTTKSSKLPSQHQESRYTSLKSTMSDIDKALEELRNDSVEHETSKSSTKVPEINAMDIQDEETLIQERSQNDGNTTRGSVFSSTADLNLSSESLKNMSKSNISIKSLEPSSSLTNPLNPKMAKNWSPDEVTDYFILLGFDKTTSGKFKEHQVSGKILLELELEHLKELEINSFGVRFEIFKEIGNIKSAVGSLSNEVHNNYIPFAFKNQTTQLMPAATVNRDEIQQPVSSKRDATTDELPSTNFDRKLSSGHKELQRPSSVVVNPNFKLHDPAEQVLDITEVPDLFSGPDIFESPGRAPKPPSYPSPVQPPQSPSFNNRSTNNNSRFLPQPTNLSKNRTSVVYSNGPILNSSTSSDTSTGKFKFPVMNGYDSNSRKTTLTSATVPSINTVNTDDSLPTISNISSNATSHHPNRNSMVYNSHKRTESGSSFVDLFNRISMLSPVKSNFDEEETKKPSERNRAVLDPTGRKSSYGHSRDTSLSEIKKHRRNSSILSFFSLKSQSNPTSPTKQTFTVDPSRMTSHSHSRSQSNSYLHARSQSYSHSRKHSLVTSPMKTSLSPINSKSNLALAHNDSNSSNNNKKEEDQPQETKHKHKHKHKSKHKHSSSNNHTSEEKSKTKNFSSVKELSTGSKELKRSPNELTQKSTKSILPRSNAKKQQTSAFTEGIRSITAKESMQNADCSGWMSKKGTGTMGTWKQRFFTLHGTRLSYFTNTNDEKERGLIDITAHRVLPARDDDRLISLYAASLGKGKYCFKLVPPQPGSKKGLTFTEPRVHYFAVENKSDMKAWLSAIIKATIDIDTSVPVISSYATPTISLSKAQTMLEEARLQTQLRDAEEEEGKDQFVWDEADNKRYSKYQIEHEQLRNSNDLESIGFEYPGGRL
ncbi:boi1p [Saccharomyces arboricola H-6]|uniref:Boi1p n=1 Tax=Saccharomyces arboricola (strain H-6 / AS 2.3317 / CBS 10644) TaxID=1160507 RepID=J8LR50_SACAR|nr:boi1p [Saccharomyces arboricola H-6]